MDLSLQQAITGELRPGESVIHAERAIPSHGLKAFGIWLFAIPWTAFSLFWEFAATGGFFTSPPTEKGPPLSLIIVFGLFGLPFIVIGFGMLLSPFYLLSKLRRRSYFVTNQRVIIFQDGRRKEIQSIPLETITETIRREAANGSGDLVLSIRTRLDSDGDTIKEERRVEVVREVKRFEDSIRQAQQRAR